MNKLLPIGTIVLLKDSTKRILVVGYLPSEANNPRIFDYSGVPYPEGLIDSKKILLFDHKQITKICHNSLIDMEVIEVLNKVNKVREDIYK